MKSKRAEFISTLKQAIKHQAKLKNAPCRCADCYSAKQKRQDKKANTS